MQGAHVDFDPATGRSVPPDFTVCSKCGEAIKKINSKNYGGLDFCQSCLKKEKYNDAIRCALMLSKTMPSNVVSKEVERRLGVKISVEACSNHRNKHFPTLRIKYKAHCPDKVIDHALSLFERGKSSSEVSKAIQEKFGFRMARGSCLKWAIKFRPDIPRPRWRPHNKLWNKHVSDGLKAYFERRSHG